MVVNKTHFTRPLNHSVQGGKGGTWGFSTGVTKEVSPAVNPEAPWVLGERDLSTLVVGVGGGPGEGDWSTPVVGAGGPGVREGDWSTRMEVEVVEEGGSSTGMTDFSGSPAGASEETEDNLSSVLGAGGPWRRGMEGEEGGSLTGMTDFSGGPAGASEESEDDLSSVLGAGGCPGEGGGGGGEG